MYLWFSYSVNLIKSSYLIEIVLVFVLGCTNSFLFSKFLSINIKALLSISFIIPKGVTFPFSSLRMFFNSSSFANDKWLVLLNFANSLILAFLLSSKTTNVYFPFLSV